MINPGCLAPNIKLQFHCCTAFNQSPVYLGYHPNIFIFQLLGAPTENPAIYYSCQSKSGLCVDKMWSNCLTLESRLPLLQKITFALQGQDQCKIRKVQAEGLCAITISYHCWQWQVLSHLRVYSKFFPVSPSSQASLTCVALYLRGSSSPGKQHSTGDLLVVECQRGLTTPGEAA